MKIYFLLLGLVKISYALESKFYIKGDPNDYVTNGSEIDLNSNTHQFKFTFTKANVPPAPLRIKNDSYDIHITSLDLRDRITLTFSFPLWSYPGVGIFEDAFRFPFQSAQRPGLDVSINSRSCNKLHGKFEILEINIDHDQLQSLAINFEQGCQDDVRELGSLRGALRYQSNIPIHKPIIISQGQIPPRSNLNHQLSISGEFGEFVSGGRSFSYNADDGLFWIFPTQNNQGVTVLYEGNEIWHGTFISSENKPLEIKSYINASNLECGPYQPCKGNVPYLSFSGDGRSCNISEGNFQVLELEYDSSHSNIIKFAADLDQHCQILNSPPRSLHSKIRFNAI